jgi:alcohol dehydrogenase class IV
MNAAQSLSYEFFAPGRIVFGWGRRAETGTLAASLGRRAFIVCGSRTLFATGVFDELTQFLDEAGVQSVQLATVSREPEVDDVDAVVNSLREHDAGDGDLLLAVGGGSAIDLAKAAAALATNRHGESVVDFLEGVGRGLKIERPPLPLMAMPTTSGTGSEATKNAVISSYDPPFKKSLRSEMLVPNIVLVDPELSVSVPATVTAHTGMDAITQLIESYISNRAQPIPQALCISGLKLAVPSIVAAVEEGQLRGPRENMAHASLLSGMALANSGLGMAHGVAAALGVHCRVPHGLACAVMLPVAMRVNREVRTRELAELGRLFTGETLTDDADAADAAIETIETIGRRIGIPTRLSEIGVQAEQLPALVTSSRGNSMSGNPRELSDTELLDRLKGML